MEYNDATTHGFHVDWPLGPVVCRGHGIPTALQQHHQYHLTPAQVEVSRPKRRRLQVKQPSFEKQPEGGETPKPRPRNETAGAPQSMHGRNGAPERVVAELEPEKAKKSRGRGRGRGRGPGRPRKRPSAANEEAGEVAEGG